MRHAARRRGALAALISAMTITGFAAPASADHKPKHAEHHHGPKKGQVDDAGPGGTAPALAGPTEAPSGARTWESIYDWTAGDGYSRWTSDSIPAGAYRLSRGLAAKAGLWLSPTGGRRYAAASGRWVFSAPGTTRIAAVQVLLRYRPRVLAHHCIEVVLEEAGAPRGAERICHPSGRGQWHTAKVSLSDAAASADRLSLMLRTPCRKRRARACAKHIPAAAPNKNAARITTVRMVLVDADEPVVTASGAFAALDGAYIDGRGRYPLHLGASDAGAGVSRLRLGHEGWPESQPDLLDRAAACDPEHHDPSMEERICPATMRADLDVDTAPMPEGTRSFRTEATDVAGHRGGTAWSVIIDRSPPAAPTTPEMAGPSEIDPTLRFTWAPGADPALPDGTAGSGTARTEYRYRRAENDFTDWAATDKDAFELPFAYDGETVEVEVRSVDAVGNASEAASGTFEVVAPDVEDPDVDAAAALWFAGEYDVSLEVAAAWMDTQNLADGVNEEVNTEILARHGLAAVSDVVAVDHTDKELQQAAEQVKDDLLADMRSWVVSVSRRTDINAVEVEVGRSADSATRARVRQVAAAAAVRVHVVEAEVDTFEMHDRQCRFPDCYPPGRGGLQIASFTKDRDGDQHGCTAGFNARSRSDDELYVMTAGHCLANFEDRRSRWAFFVPDDHGDPDVEPLGWAHDFYDDKRGDAGIIRLVDTFWSHRGIRPWVFVQPSKATRRDPHYVIQRTSFSQLKRVVCYTGAVTGTHCGEVSKLGAGEENFGELRNCDSKKGDSGGPIYKHHVAYGLVKGGRGNILGNVLGSCRLVYQGIRSAEDELNVDVVTARR